MEVVRRTVPYTLMVAIVHKIDSMLCVCVFEKSCRRGKREQNYPGDCFEANCTARESAFRSEIRYGRGREGNKCSLSQPTHSHQTALTNPFEMCGHVSAIYELSIGISVVVRNLIGHRIHIPEHEHCLSMDCLLRFCLSALLQCIFTRQIDR